MQFFRPTMSSQTVDFFFISFGFLSLKIMIFDFRKIFVLNLIRTLVFGVPNTEL